MELIACEAPERDRMNIAICDDEKEIRELLGNKIRTLYPNIKLTFYASGEELLADEAPDILLLDIQMPGKNGMETAKELRRRGNKTIIVFITAVASYVFESFDVEAFYYLVKPFTDEKLKDVMERAVRRWQDTVSLREAGSQTLLLTVKGVHISVSLDEIIYAEVFNRKMILHTRKEKIEYYGKMRDLERQAGEDFFRPHRAFLINLQYVERYDSSTIYLKGGTALMAKQKYPEFVKRYHKWNQKRCKQKNK